MSALKIRITKDGEEIKTFGFDDLEKSEILVGRASDSDIRLEDRAIGRNHAAFKTLQGQSPDRTNVIQLERRTKFGKLFLNGKEIGESAMISSGDVIRIADYEMSVEAATGTLKKNSATQPTPKTEPLVAENSASALPSAAPSELELAQAMGSEMADSGAVSEDEKTSFVAIAKLRVFLTFKPGQALVGENEVLEFEMTKDEIVLGRGTVCDVILTDKKASRKHCAVVRTGATYSIKDLESGNGTLVNGEEVSVHELSSDDVIKVGDSEFSFKAVNKDYSAQEEKGDFLQVDHSQELANVDQPEVIQDLPMADFAPPTPEAGPSYDSLIPPPQTEQVLAPAKPKSLLEKFRALPKGRQGIVAVILLLGLWALSDFMNEDPDAAKKAAATSQSTKGISPQEKDFQQLPKEKRDFVLQTYQIVLDQMNHRDFDGALNNLDKIFAIAPNFTYKDARELAEVAKKGRELLAAQEEEEKRKKEDDERKKKIVELERIAQGFFDQDKRDEMENVFVRILELDPENALVTKLKSFIDDKAAKQRTDAEEKAKFESMQKIMRDVLEEGNVLFKQERYYEAMDKWAEVAGVGTDAGIIQEAKDLIEKAKAELQSKRDPHINSAKTAYEAKNYTLARQEYSDALRIDPKCTECREGMKRIQRDVHERSQRIYIEAIMAESVSDLNQAKKKYLECYKASVPEDDYYGRCWRKYYRFITIENPQDATQELEAAGVRAPASNVIDDEYTDQVLENY